VSDSDIRTVRTHSTYGFLLHSPGGLRQQ